MGVTAGTDTYGRVKSVRGTPVVTKFVMIQFLPICPIESFYFIGNGAIATSGIPFIAQTYTAVFSGIPLARIDLVSVATAYLRGLFATMVLIGFMAIFPVIGYLSGEHLDRFATTVMRWLLGCLAVGIVGGVLSYLVPLGSRRERSIREYCGELLGVCIDPARVIIDDAIAMEKFVSQLMFERGTRSALIQQLISSRSSIAQGIEVKTMEQQSDELVTRLNQIAKLAV